MLPQRTPSLKPSPWVLDRSRIGSRALELWKDCVLAWPLVAYGDGRSADWSGNQLHGVPGESSRLLAVVGMEDGTLSEWDDTASKGSSAHGLTVTAGSALGGGAFGLNISLNLSTALQSITKYIQQWNTQTMRIRFRLDPNTITADTNAMTFFRTVATGGLERESFQFDKSGANYRVRVRMKADDGTNKLTSFYTISDAPHTIEAEWKKATSPSAADGTMKLWIDGTLKETVTGIQRYNLTNPSEIRVGMIAAVAPGLAAWTGDIFLDQIVVRDDGTEIAEFDYSGTGVLDWRVGTSGPAVDSTASNDKLAVLDPKSDLLDNLTQLSIECLFRPDTIPGAGVKAGLVGKFQPFGSLCGWRLYLLNDELVFECSSSGTSAFAYTTTAANLAANTWYRVVVTYSAGTVLFYLNGKSIAFTPPGSPQTSICATTAKLLAGATMDPFAEPIDPFDGMIGCVRLWRGRKLLASDVTYLEEDPWAMFAPDSVIPSFALLHIGATVAAGPWSLAATVPKGLQMQTIGGLLNGTSYDVQLKTVDVTGNESSGSSIVAATPAAGAGRATPLRFPRRPADPVDPIRRHLR